MNRAGFGIRLGAMLIDGVILGIVYFIAGKIFTPRIETVTADQLASYIRRAMLVSSIVYLAYSLTEVFKAATPGKMILGLKIVDESGAPAPQEKLWKRWAFKWSSTILLLLWVVSGIGIVYNLSSLAGLAVLVSCLMALRATKQALHDQLAGTAVLATKTAPIPAFAPATPPPPQH
jgi:uncharacterized RDD family membrane protein YckC